MSRRLTLMVAAGILALLTGCGFDKTYLAIDPTAWPAKPARYEMPVSNRTPDRAHRTIGELTVSSGIRPNYKQTGIYDQIVEEIRREACRRGADAVINLRAQDGSREASRARLTLSGTLIVFTAPPPPAERS